MTERDSIMSNTEFYCLPTIIGSMPHTDPKKACALITRYLKDIPAWPKLPTKSFLEKDKFTPQAGKGHVTGPLSWGMTVTDENKRAILYHEILGDAVPRLLKLKAAWQEKELKKISKNTITFIDEPYMASYGSSVAAGAFSKPEKIAEMIDEVCDGISGLKGITCCGNTDWSG